MQENNNYSEFKNQYNPQQKPLNGQNTSTDTHDHKKTTNRMIIIAALVIALLLITSAIFSFLILQDRLNSSQPKRSATSGLSIVSTSSLSNSSPSPSQPISSRETQIIAKQTYENQFFPNFKLNYGNDWQFSTTTTPNGYYDGALVNRTIKLQKGSSVLTMVIEPIVPTGCNGGIDQAATYNKDLGNGLFVKSYTSDGKTNFEVNKDKNLTSCNLSNRLVSNIPTSSIKKYQDSITLAGDKVQFVFAIEFSDNIKVGSAELTEVESILSNSKFE